MSTKATIVYDDDFHFYHEMFDDHHVYLQMRGTHFEAGYNHVMVPIPIHIWEVIRKRGGPDLSLAGLSDEELQARVEREVDKRIAEYQDAVTRGDQWTGILALAGSSTFGSADTTRQEQIAQGLADYHEWRRDQQEVRDAIERLEAKNRPVAERPSQTDDK